LAANSDHPAGRSVIREYASVVDEPGDAKIDIWCDAFDIAPVYLFLRDRCYIADESK